MLGLQWKKNTKVKMVGEEMSYSVKDHIILLKLLSDTKLFLKIIAITHIQYEYTLHSHVE